MWAYICNMTNLASTHDNCAFKSVIYLPEPQTTMMNVLLQISLQLHVGCEGFPNASNLRPSFCKIVPYVLHRKKYFLW